MRKKILSIALVGLIGLVGCTTHPGTSSSSDTSSTTPVSSSDSSSSSSSSSSYVDPDGIINVHFEAGDHVTLTPASGFTDVPNSEGYYNFNVKLDEGYTLVSLTATGDRTGASYAVAGSGSAYNIVMHTEGEQAEDVTITATAAEAVSTAVPDEAVAGVLDAASSNKVLTYTMVDIMTDLGGGFNTTNTSSYGDDVAIREISGAMYGSNVFVKDENGNIAMPSLGIDNREVLDANLFSGNPSTAAWDSTSGLFYCTNPISHLMRERSADGSSLTAVDGELLKERFYFTSTTEDDLTTYHLNLKPELYTDSYMVGWFAPLLNIADMALGSIVTGVDTITDLSLTLNTDYQVTTINVSFTGTTEYMSADHPSSVTYQFTNFESVEDVADPYAPKTDESSKDMLTGAAGELVSQLAEGASYTLTVDPVEQQIEGRTGIGFDGLPNGITYSDKAAQGGTIYAFDNYVISDQLAPTSNSYDHATGKYLDSTEGTYAAVLNREADTVAMYNLTTEDVVSDNTYLSDDQMYDFFSGTPVALTADSFDLELGAINYHFFTANGDGTYTFSMDHTDLTWNTMDPAILSSICSPLDYILGDSSAMWASSSNSNHFAAYPGVTELTYDFSKAEAGEIGISVILYYNYFLGKAAYEVEVDYTISNIGTTTRETISDAAKADLTALEAYLAA